MTEDYKDWHLMPLEGKYYGTIVLAGNGAEITVWGDRCWKLSPRERAKSEPFDSDWTEAECMSDGHYEDLNDYKKACLIAAAPELLEALMDARDMLTSHPDFQGEGSLKMYDDAIAKALGE